MKPSSILTLLAALLAAAAVWYALRGGARPSPGGAGANSAGRGAGVAEVSPEQKALAAARKLEAALDPARPFAETEREYAQARAELDSALRGVSGGVAGQLRRAAEVFADALRVLGKREQQAARRQGAGGQSQFIALDEEDADDVALAELLTKKYGLRPAREPDIYTTFDAAEAANALRQKGRDFVARAEAASR